MKNRLRLCGLQILDELFRQLRVWGFGHHPSRVDDGFFDRYNKGNANLFPRSDRVGGENETRIYIILRNVIDGLYNGGAENKLGLQLFPQARRFQRAFGVPCVGHGAIAKSDAFYPWLKPDIVP